MNKRRSLTPHTGMKPPGTHAMRRGGARQQVSERVTFKRDDATLFEGWALNVSRGGLRAILDVEEASDGAPSDRPRSPDLGDEYAVVVGDPDAEGAGAGAAKRGRIVWLQEEPDGFVVGVEYLDADGRPLSVAPSADVASTEAPGGTRKED